MQGRVLPGDFVVEEVDRDSPPLTNPLRDAGSFLWKNAILLARQANTQAGNQVKVDRRERQEGTNGRTNTRPNRDRPRRSQGGVK
mgnify:CR=1 FL=1